VRRIAGWLGLALAAALLVVGLRRLVTYEVADRSMAPTLQPGDWALGWRGRRARRGDVVVLEHPGRPGFEMVKRVAAGPGASVDGMALGAGEIWVLGDNPGAGSVDSRALGAIPVERVRARLFLRYHPGPLAPIR
jgi:hypothetical protein